MDVPLIPGGMPTASTLHALQTRLDANVQGGDPGETAKKFESVLSTLLVKEMRRSLPEGFFGGGADGDIYSGWLDEHVGQTLAERDALHMRDLITRSVLQKAASSDVQPQAGPMPIVDERAAPMRVAEPREVKP